MSLNEQQSNFEPVEIKRQIRTLTSLDNWHCLLYLLKDYLIIGACITLCFTVSWWLYPLAWLVIGTRQRGLANLLHAASHNTLAKNRYWNFVAGTVLSGYLVGQKYVLYCYTHVTQHHGHLGDPAHDPDYQQHLAAGLYKKRTKAEFVWAYVAKAFLGLKIPQYLSYVCRDRFFGRVPARYDNRIVSQRFDNWLFALFWVGIFTVSSFLGIVHWLLLFWLFPLMSSAMIIGWFIEMAEHFPLVREPRSRLYLTRNRNGNRFELLFTGVHHDNYHLEHHLNPNVPMWHLPQSQAVRLQNPIYRRWDEQWGGIFTKCDRKPTRKTFYEYIFSEEANILHDDYPTGGALDG
ncbi:fatty acid desaturase [Modicisalibacter xianhensis]|uniref:Fatty acid desaturase n=1 Tax=Modicisalibacter xianhensis TaxID=442341 RepID=A0A4R8FIK8_9GAMM|nr:fatty acid desaturase family protein [Halomonas xianhensis]TDX23708.1 fatty acid desaturase [Halomonas xianhensis]